MVAVQVTVNQPVHYLINNSNKHKEDSGSFFQIHFSNKPFPQIFSRRISCPNTIYQKPFSQQVIYPNPPHIFVRILLTQSQFPTPFALTCHFLGNHFHKKPFPQQTYEIILISTSSEPIERGVWLLYLFEQVGYLKVISIFLNEICGRSISRRLVFSRMANYTFSNYVWKKRE